MGVRKQKETKSDSTRMVAAGDGVGAKMRKDAKAVNAIEKFEAGDASYSVDGIVDVERSMQPQPISIQAIYRVQQEEAFLHLETLPPHPPALPHRQILWYLL